MIFSSSTPSPFERFEPDYGQSIRYGRSVNDGYARGWGLQFGTARDAVRRDRLYQEAVKIAAGRTVVSEDNRMNIYLIIKYFLEHIETGDIVEFGAYKGGNALFMAYVSKRIHPGIKVYALDSFKGMPDVNSEIDAHSEGDFADVNLEELLRYRDQLGLDNLEFVEGFFEDTAPDLLKRTNKVSLTHIDCDIQSAVAYSYDVIKPFMVPGGYYVLDEALYSSCLGATEAVEDLFIRRDGLYSEQVFPHYVFRAPFA